ncbi:MAG: rhodanese-like domain-containing protein [Vicinamibacteria bacterium]
MGRQARCPTSRLIRALARALAIVLAAALLGLAWNAFSSRGVALNQNVLIRAEDEVIEAREAKARLDRGALFLDARPLMFWELERIPGSLPLPEDAFDAHFAKLEPKLRSTFDIVVYCSGFGCEASHLVAARLRERGIQAAILHEGWPAWTDAGYPIETGREP